MNDEAVLRYLTMAVVIVTALPAHELAHGLAADRLGDHTAREQGRLTLNPFVHLDLFGTLALCLFGFGWAKPVPINSSRFKKPKRDLALTALAGPLANLLLGLVTMALFKVYVFYADMNSSAGWMFGQVIYTILWTNLTLSVFNLLPVPPLDGSKILDAALPFSIRMKMRKAEKFFYVALILLLYLGFLQIPLNFLSSLLFSGLNWATAPVDFLLRLIG